ncbi:LysR family transcriptional regulator substrate-binding protein [Lactobacillus sp. PV012]|nr:LysR family transcriptional regulator substrate-binding protein [Lactobacillus sp. PV012]QNQ82340.1 LysR family transcriptional regulator substrate-binding protein [Lactobacillus sp. PV012]
MMEKVTGPSRPANSELDNKVIKIGVLNIMEARILEEFLIHYNSLKPNVEFVVEFFGRSSIWNKLRNGEIDLAFTYLPESSLTSEELKSIIVKKVFEDSIVFLTHDKNTPATYEGLTKTKWVSYAADTYLPDLIRSTYQLNFLPNPPEVVARFSATYQLLQFAQARPYNTYVTQSFYQAHRSKISLYPVELQPKIYFQSYFIIKKLNSKFSLLDSF